MSFKRGAATLTIVTGLTVIGGIAVALLQAPPPDETWRLLVGMFGVPGAAAWVLFGWLQLKKIRDEPVKPWDEAKIIAQLQTMEKSLADDARRHRDDLSDDLRGALMLVAEQLKSTIKDAVREERKSG